MLGALTACQPEIVEDSTAAPDTTCQGKCDGAAGEARALVDYADFGQSSCAKTGSSTTWGIECTFGPAETYVGWFITAIQAHVTDDTGTYTESFALTGDTRQVYEVTGYRAGEVPDLEVRFTLSDGVQEFDYAQRHIGEIRKPGSDTESNFDFGWPISVREVSFWPSIELIANNAAVHVTLESEFSSNSDALTFSGASEATLTSPLNSDGNARELVGVIHTIPFMGNGPRALVKVNGVEKTTTLRQAGHYVIDADGRLTQTAVADLPAIATTTLDDYVAPCSVCTSAQVCVADTCVERDAQSQNYSFVYGCDEPTATCDAGQNGDCAQGHVCVEGLCRNMECQEQAYKCEETPGVCEVDSHCPAEHVCAGGRCRNIECQVQDSTTCSQDDLPPCEENSDCASGHVCGSGKCRQKSKCQDERYYYRNLRMSCADVSRLYLRCDDDSDCGPANWCREGRCRSYAEDNITGARHCN